MLRWMGDVADVGELYNAYKLLVSKPQGKKPVVRQGHRWDNIKIDFKGIRHEGVAWIYPTQGMLQAVVNMLMYPRFT